MELLNGVLVTRQKYTDEKMKKAYILKLLELFKTRNKKSSPNLFNFYVILAGHDMSTDAGRATKCSWYFEAPWLETKVQLKEDISKMIFTKKPFEHFRRRKELKQNS